MKTIALSVDYGWIDKAETTLKSIYAHNQDVKTYIINPDIPHEWFMNINRYLKELNSEVLKICQIPKVAFLRWYMANF